MPFLSGVRRGQCYPTIPAVAQTAQALLRGMVVFGPSTPTAGTLGVPIDIDFADIQYQVGTPFAKVIAGQLIIQEAGIYFVSSIIGYDTPGAHSMIVGVISVFQVAVGISPANLDLAQASGHIAPGMFGTTVPQRLSAQFTPGANGNIPGSSAAVFVQRFSGPTP